MPDNNHIPNLPRVKQRLTRRLNDLTTILVDCQVYGQGWDLPTEREELVTFIRTRRANVLSILDKSHRKINDITAIHDETLRELNGLSSEDSEMAMQLTQEFVS